MRTWILTTNDICTLKLIIGYTNTHLQLTTQTSYGVCVSLRWLYIGVKVLVVYMWAVYTYVSKAIIIILLVSHQPCEAKTEYEQEMIITVNCEYLTALLKYFDLKRCKDYAPMCLIEQRSNHLFTLPLFLYIYFTTWLFCAFLYHQIVQICAGA